MKRAIPILMILVMTTACRMPPPNTPEREPWETAQLALQYVRSSVDVLVSLVPREAIELEHSERCGEQENCVELPELIAQVLTVGEDAISAWEAGATAPATWAVWIGRALSGVHSLLGIASDHGAELPSWVSPMIEGGSAVLLTLAGEAPPETCSVEPGGKLTCDSSWVWSYAR